MEFLNVVAHFVALAIVETDVFDEFVETVIVVAFVVALIAMKHVAEVDLAAVSDEFVEVVEI